MCRSLIQSFEAVAAQRPLVRFAMPWGALRIGVGDQGLKFVWILFFLCSCYYLVTFYVRKKHMMVTLRAMIMICNSYDICEPWT